MAALRQARSAAPAVLSSRRSSRRAAARHVLTWRRAAAPLAEGPRRPGYVALRSPAGAAGVLCAGAAVDAVRHRSIRKLLDYAFESYLGIAIDRKDYF